MKKTFITTVLLFSLSTTQANDDISYNFIEFGYAYLDLNNGISPDGLSLDATFGLSEHLYFAAHVENLSDRGRDFDQHDLALGFHTNWTTKTDFYTDIRIGKLDFDNVDGTAVGLFAGTRTAFNDRFELISKLGFTNVDNIEHDDGDNVILYQAEVKGLIKFGNHQALSLGIESFDGQIGGSVGYRLFF